MTVLKNNNINVILDISYGDDNVNSVSQRIKVVHWMSSCNVCYCTYLQEVDARIVIAWLPPSSNKVVAEFWCMVRILIASYVVRNLCRYV